MLQSLNLHSISPIVFGNRVWTSQDRLSHSFAAAHLCFSSIAKPKSRNPRKLGFTKVARSHLCLMKSVPLFDPAPTGDHATQQPDRASAHAAQMTQILGHKPNNLHLGPKSPTSQNTQQMNPMQSRHQNPLTPRGVPRRAISMNQHLPSSSKAQTWLQEGVW